MVYRWRICSDFPRGLLRGVPSAWTHVNHLESQLYSPFQSWPSRWGTTDLCTAILRGDFRHGLPVTYAQPFSIGTFGMGYHWLTCSHFASGLLRGFASVRTHVTHLESFGFDANETCISMLQKGDFYSAKGVLCSMYFIFLYPVFHLLMRGGGLGSRPIFKKFNEPYAPS